MEILTSIKLHSKFLSMQSISISISEARSDITLCKNGVTLHSGRCFSWEHKIIKYRRRTWNKQPGAVVVSTLNVNIGQTFNEC